QSKDAELAERFGKLAQFLNSHESKILEELISVQGKPVEIGGYFQPNVELVSKAMRPSATLNGALDSL
ncbi:MAG: NADP-dependent isocitrate dehydrogenase, partial [Pseudohongiella sp.]|nr:NADP-dependent isocitrate dehydrogenase [Pseudohongiella sp.]